MEPQFVISAPAPGGNLISDLGSATLYIVPINYHHERLKRKKRDKKSAHLRHGARCNKISVVAHSQGRIRQPQTGKIRSGSNIIGQPKGITKLARRAMPTVRFLTVAGIGYIPHPPQEIRTRRDYDYPGTSLPFFRQCCGSVTLWYESRS